MTYSVRTYPQDKSFHHDYYAVLHFLLKHNEQGNFLHFHWSRWEWMFGRDNLNLSDLSHIRLFYDDTNTLRGVFTYEDRPTVWFAIYDNCPILKKFIVETWYHQTISGPLYVPQDQEMIGFLNQLSCLEQHDHYDPISRYHPTQEPIQVPSGYHLASLQQDYRLEQIHHVLWRGFNHGDEVDYSLQNLEDRRYMTSTPHYHRAFSYVAIYKNRYVSFANIFYLPHTKTALVEPVATVPDHRQKGLARACILSAIAAVYAAGASEVYIGSDRSFYQNMGFKLEKKALCFKKP